MGGCAKSCNVDFMSACVPAGFAAAAEACRCVSRDRRVFATGEFGIAVVNRVHACAQNIRNIDTIGAASFTVITGVSAVGKVCQTGVGSEERFVVCGDFVHPLTRCLPDDPKP